MPKPQVLHHMDKATTHMIELINNKALIGIFGDYDVDGATSTALLTRYFFSINQKIHTYIPDRKKEGYGPTVNSFNILIDQIPKVCYYSNIKSKEGMVGPGQNYYAKV